MENKQNQNNIDDNLKHCEYCVHYEQTMPGRGRCYCFARIDYYQPIDFGAPLVMANFYCSYFQLCEKRVARTR